jgi:hypothetical protein
MYIFCNISHSVPTFCLTKGYPLRFLVLTHERRLASRMFPPKSHTSSSLYRLLILQLKPLLCIIILQHQSLIEPNTSKNTTPVVMYPLAQQKSKQQLHTYASSWFCTIYHRWNPKTTSLCPFASELPFLSWSNNILFPLPCMLEAPLATHHMHANLFHITHK